MITPTLTSHEQEPQMWEHLKQAIALSSGFQQWQEKQLTHPNSDPDELEKQVCDYLRETLETLAY
jgi:hypothetical protein